jgi:microcystin-dependent protein
MKDLTRMFVGAVMVILLGIPSTGLAASEPFAGEIMMFGNNFCPRGWMNANGQLLSIHQNQALFSLFGTTYGGDGRTQFGLPDLRGRVPLHVGKGPGLTQKRQGQKGGAERHTLNITEIPPHKHALNATKGGANQQSPTGNLLAQQSRKSRIYAPFDAKNRTPMDANAIGAAGNGKPHNNLQPFLTLRYCVAVQGIYPSRN